MTFEQDVIAVMLEELPCDPDQTLVEGYDRLSALVRAAQMSEKAASLPHGERVLVRTIAARVRRSQRRHQRTQLIRRRPAHVAVALAGAGLWLSATAAAADVLPAPVQRAISSAAAVVGIEVPSDEAPVRTGPRSEPSGPITGPAQMTGNPPAAAEPGAAADDAPGAPTPRGRPRSNGSGSSPDKGDRQQPDAAAPSSGAGINASTSSDDPSASGNSSDAPGHGGTDSASSDDTKSNPSNAGGQSVGHRQNLR